MAFWLNKRIYNLKEKITQTNYDFSDFDLAYIGPKSPKLI